MNQKDCVLCSQPLNIGESVYHSDCTTLYSAVLNGNTQPCTNCRTTGRVGISSCYACNDRGYTKPQTISRLDEILRKTIL